MRPTDTGMGLRESRYGQVIMGAKLTRSFYNKGEVYIVIISYG